MKFFIKATLATALASLISSAALAESPFYIGANIGESDNSDSACQGIVIKCDKKDTAFKIYGGYHFTDNIAFELDYHDLGESTFTLRNFPWQGQLVDLDNGETTYTAVGLSAVPSIQIIDNLKAFARIGFVNATVETKTTVSVPGIQITSKTRSRDTSGRVGVGLQYDLTEQFGIRAEYEELRNLGDDETGEVDAHILSAGLVYKF